MDFLCQNCHANKACVHVTDSFPEKRVRHLCEECAEKEGIIFKHQAETTPEILQHFLKQKVAGRKVVDRTCPKCGMTFREFQSRGLLGCPDDYIVFREFLEPLIERAHEGAKHHVGKVPVKTAADVQKKTALLRLRRELQEAVDQEKYETAARLRDQIQTLEAS